MLVGLALLAAGCSDGDGGSSSSSEAAEASSSFEVFENVPYWDNEFRHILDVYLPESTGEPVPTILAIHGGAFRSNSKALYSRIGRYYAENGFAFVATNYRLTPDHGGYPVQVEDSFCALAWVHQNADEYGFDSDRVVVWGGSAGGYLASMVATANDPSIYSEDCPNEPLPANAIGAAVILYGFFDFTSVDDFPPSDFDNLELFWGAPWEEIPVERLEEMSPIVQIDGTEPPFILVHGTADTDVPSVMSQRFAAALEEAGVEVELVLLPDVGHAFELTSVTSDELTFTFNKVGEFLDRHLNS